MEPKSAPVMCALFGIFLFAVGTAYTVGALRIPDQMGAFITGLIGGACVGGGILLLAISSRFLAPS